MQTTLAFILALGLLISIHEYGHYRVAVACGVKVLRFSLGFGPAFFRWTPKKQKPNQETEFVLSLLPLGGYVKMLDEREGDVPSTQRHLAFNNQPLKSRVAIVAAGPLANLLLAVVLYAVVNWTGVQETKPILAKPVAGSIAEAAGLLGGETVLRIAQSDDIDMNWQAVQSFEDVRWSLTQSAIYARDMVLDLGSRQVRLPLSQLAGVEHNESSLAKIGLLMPWTKPEVGELVPSGAGAKAGLQKGDLVQAVDGQLVVDGSQLRHLIRAAVQDGQAQLMHWRVLRSGRVLDIDVLPAVVQDQKQGAVTSTEPKSNSPRSAPALIGKIGAYIGAPPEQVTLRYGLVEGLWRGVQRTWEISGMTLNMMGKMLVGQASVKNLSGPITMAEYAGKSAQVGWSAYLGFLALISVSLGVLNLLPLPVLDGGHLMYYLYEAIFRKSIPEIWMTRMQQVGSALLLVVMVLALYNDIARQFG